MDPKQYLYSGTGRLELVYIMLIRVGWWKTGLSRDFQNDNVERGSNISEFWKRSAAPDSVNQGVLASDIIGRGDASLADR